MNELYTIRMMKVTDRNFILSTWLRGLRFGCDPFYKIPSELYYTKYQKVIELLLANVHTDTVIACLKDDPDVILAYAVIGDHGERLHWAYTKKSWRGLGIQKKLIPSSIKTVSHLTKSGEELAAKRGWSYDPFL